VLDRGVGATARPTRSCSPRTAGRAAVAGRLPDGGRAGGRLRFPKGFNARSPQARRDLASTLRALDLPYEGRAGRRRAAADDDSWLRCAVALRRHPVHGCDDREAHMRWAERWHRLREETDKLERRVSGKTSSIARTFDRVCACSTSSGYLQGEQVAPAGPVAVAGLQRVRPAGGGEPAAGLWDELSPGRAGRRRVDARLQRPPRRRVQPAGAVRPVQAALKEMDRLWRSLAEVESEAGVQFLRQPDNGFAWATWRWAGGATLEQVLQDDPDMTAGDFVRWCKQIVDLLGQIALVAEDLSPRGARCGDTPQGDRGRPPRRGRLQQRRLTPALPRRHGAVPG
jgi:ATP-dependent RNA helicase HelY